MAFMNFDTSANVLVFTQSSVAGVASDDSIGVFHIPIAICPPSNLFTPLRDY